MRVTYLGHSGFLVQWDNALFLFDFAEGQLPQLSIDFPLYVFVSHKHADHYSPEIFQRTEQFSKRTFLLSKEISEARQQKSHIQAVGKHEQFTIGAGDDKIFVRTMASTDLGVAWFIQYHNQTLYHAGDLNWWAWPGESKAYNHNMEANFKREIDSLAGENIDLAFLPLDPRQEEFYSLGFDYFMQKTNTAVAIPMHLWEQYDLIPQFLMLPCTKSYRDRVQNVTHVGQIFDINK